MYCTCVGRGACSSHMKPCAARSPFSIQSWSTKRAWLGNSGHSSTRQDKVRRGHTLEHTPACCGWCVIVIVSVYLSTNPIVCRCFFIRLSPRPQHPAFPSSSTANSHKSPELCLWAQVSTLVFRFHTSGEGEKKNYNSAKIFLHYWLPIKFIFENCTTFCLQNSLLHFYSSYILALTGSLSWVTELSFFIIFSDIK